MYLWLRLGFLLLCLWPFWSFGQLSSRSETKPVEQKGVQRNQLTKDIFFSPSGGVRSRYFNRWDASAGAFTEGERDSLIMNRFQFDLLLHKGEFFKTFGRFLHINQWGRASSATGDSSIAVKDSFSSENGLIVSEAWGYWKVTESLGIKFGRSPLSFGRGLSYGANQWFDIPNTFDHFDILWDWEYLNLSLVGAKVQELSPVTDQTISPDPEENHYIIDIALQNMTDWVQVLDIHFIQMNRDNGSSDGGTSVLPALNVQRIGLDFAFEFEQWVGEFYYSSINGKQRGGLVQTISQTVFDFNTHYHIPSTANLFLKAGFHVDSGDNNGADTVNRHFDGFYYDSYGKTGRMDFVRWGNLTSYNLGLSVEAAHQLNLGFDYYVFSKTKGVDASEYGFGGSFLNEKINSGDLTLSDSDDFGSELDIWMDWHFPSQVKLSATLGVFLPGDTFAQGATTSGKSANENIFQFLTEISIFF